MKFGSAKIGVAAVLVATLLALMSVPAHAVLMTADPDAASDMDILNNAFAGVTLSAIVGNTGGNVYARNDGAATTGSRSFGNDITTGQVANIVWFEAGFSNTDGPVLRADFSSLTDFVSIDINNQDGFDAGFLRAFDINDNLLVEDTSGVSGAGFETLTVSTAGPSIAYILASGNSAQDSVHLDNLRFNVIPEPAAAMLFVSGLIGLGLSRRRR